MHDANVQLRVIEERQHHVVLIRIHRPLRLGVDALHGVQQPQGLLGQRAVVMAWEPLQQRTPHGALGRHGTAGATPLKAQITAQLSRSSVLVSRCRPFQNPGGFT